jgi:methionyl-tRNA formyltransferase
MSPLRMVFMGTPDLAQTCLLAVLQDPEHEVVGVVTQPDRPKGRDLRLQASPVKEFALKRNLPVLQPQRARDPQFFDELKSLKPDIILVAAFGQILPQAILDLPRFGCLNVHTSLLPKYRGAAPIQWAIINGEPETGVTIMRMDIGLDTGAILTQEKTIIGNEDTSETLHNRLAQIGGKLLVATIPEYVGGNIIARAQPTEGVSYAPKIMKDDGLVNWADKATKIHDRIRGLVPWPGAFTYFPSPQGMQTLKIWQATTVAIDGNPGEVLQSDQNGILVGCGEGGLLIQVLQREGRRKVTAAQFIAGNPLEKGVRLGKPPT